MTSELKLNTYNLFELGEKVDKLLHDNGIKKKSTLIIKVNENELTKIDEDLYYRNNPKGKDYIPTEGEIIVTFKNLDIKIIAEKKETE